MLQVRIWEKNIKHFRPSRSRGFSEVARRAGVSIATVSRVMNGNKYVAGATRRKTLRAIKELGYQPDEKKRRFFSVLHSGTKTIALITSPWIYAQIQKGEDFFMRTLVAVQQEIESQRQHLLIECASAGEDEDNHGIRCVSEGRVDGVVMFGCGASERRTVKLAAQAPVVIINHQYQISRVDVVIPNVEQAIMGQMDHLLGLGHRRIACFKLRPSDGCPQGETWWQHRLAWQAYERACADHHLPLPSAYTRPIQSDVGDVKNKIAKFLDRVLACQFLDRVLACEEPPTAILTYDTYAAELIRQLENRGLRVPRDISIVGYDDESWGRPVPIPLTTYRQNFAAMGRTAVRLLRERIREPDQAARLVMIEGEMIIRKSTGPRAGAAKAPLSSISVKPEAGNQQSE